MSKPLFTATVRRNSLDKLFAALDALEKTYAPDAIVGDAVRDVLKAYRELKSDDD